jgi:PHD/YefM family antitoxin component YafN of YafNO toxin-antitoxin module
VRSHLCYSENIQASELVMQSYPLAAVGDHSSELFEQAVVEPVLLTEASKPGFVIMSVQNYQNLLDRLAALEDQMLGRLAEESLQHSQMVGIEAFTAELQKLAEFNQNRS